MSVNIVYRNQDEKLFWQYWQELFKQTQAPTRYLPVSLKTWLITSKASGLFQADQSFIYVVNNQPLAGVFLPIEKKGQDLVCSVMDDYIDAPLFATRTVEKKVFNLIDEIAQKNKVAKIMFLVDPLESAQYNYLQKYNYLDTSVLNYVIDLNTSSDLLAACRKGHRGDIKSILKNKDFEVFYIDKQTADFQIHEQYRQLHHKAAGRVTRPKETFDLQFEKLKQGHAVLFGLKYQGKSIAFSYFEFHANKAAYTSAADDPDFDQLALYHVLIFEAMNYLKKIGVSHIDTEPPSAPSSQLDYYPDSKELNIALFKRGFGGSYVQNYRGIKYFSKKMFETDAKNFIQQYSQSALVEQSNN